MIVKAPRWDLSSIYESFDCADYAWSCDTLKGHIKGLESALDIEESIIGKRNALPAGVLIGMMNAWESAQRFAGNLSAYAEAVYTADTRDARAKAEINRIEALRLPLGKVSVRMRALLAANKERVERYIRDRKAFAPYVFFLREAIERASYQMTPDMEDLAGDLARSGGAAWGRLHEALASAAGAVLDGERKSVTELRSLAHSADRGLRRKAYEAELSALKAVEMPMAAALNGVKGHALTVDGRRGWKTALDKSAFQSRLKVETIAALISAIEEALPMFRRYLAVKARLLGIGKCAFFDLFAPVGGGTGVDGTADGNGAVAWEWEEATDFVTRCFKGFDPEMADFAKRIYAANWVDAEMRDGKIGGAYCTDFPFARQARILCNFDGTFDSVLTLAHETGHAWHHEVIKDLPWVQTFYPMTLAETASIFAETLVFEAAMAGTGAAASAGASADTGAKTALLEGSVKDSCQTLVDILSRYYFETELLAVRKERELPPEELCALMLDAQRKAYGDGLDPAFLHPYMWAVKPHYYSHSLNFYNYPYAFGHLFALSLYAKLGGGGGFAAASYQMLLENTGCCSVEDLALDAGFDLSDSGFWRQGLAIIERRVDDLERTASGGTASGDIASDSTASGGTVSGRPSGGIASDRIAPSGIASGRVSGVTGL
jgi:pepF/M3 family oligoendopeptidase